MIQVEPLSPFNSTIENQLLMELNECLIQEELFWHQKSRNQWFTSSNLNTRFFHLSYYKNLFTSQLTLHSPHIDLLTLITPFVFDVENDSLWSILSDQEIKDVVFSFGSYKAPSPDGMSAIFYKTYWNTICKEVIDSIKAFFVDGHMLKEMNHTFITLIPKTPNLCMVKQFRPISLCNISYKIISKILANRLKSLLPNLVSPWQAASVPGRNIQDNSIIAYEIFHTMHQKFFGSKVFVALKLDMEKAFDKVDGLSSLSIFKHFGFSNKWIHLINQCISTPTFSILNNGSLASFF